ncbi:hypothetical protein JFN88_10570 [Paenibacillus sp. MAHUQ-46]|uniref:30S ribosomal protein S7 n=1 Tax=Paenibacillus roseus TaxID=2798579 RepID=A0A934MQC5_9BACL|nr:hypothetical protein [Paenibacillus roseus]MBJ6361733.1 hypothetical protein [Paenibacillus roseus]
MEHVNQNKEKLRIKKRKKYSLKKKLYKTASIQTKIQRKQAKKVGLQNVHRTRLMIQRKNRQEFSSYIIKKFINVLMKNGEKGKALKIFNETLLHLKKRAEAQIKLNHSLNVFKIFFIALQNVSPGFEVRKVRRAGTSFTVPAMISEKKAINQGIRWLVEVSTARRGSNPTYYEFAHCLAEEIYLASLKQGKAREKRKELHNIVLANRAYVRYRWW